MKQATQRISNFRGKVKKITNSVAGTVFNLRPGDVTKVNWLQEGIRFIFPYTYDLEVAYYYVLHDHGYLLITHSSSVE